VVVDASVIIKIFKIESDTGRAKELIQWAVSTRTALLAPTLLPYEVLSAALHVGVRFADVQKLLFDLRVVSLHIEEPGATDLDIAERIATGSLPGGGYPSLNDSIYHAMAISRGIDFVTADLKHIRKTSHLGNVVSLADWRPA
jgi:predicted nucleic acid-binding protein